MIDENTNNVVMIFLFVIIVYLFMCNNNNSNENRRLRTNYNELKNTIKKMENFSNLACITESIDETGTITIPANVRIQGNFNVDGNIDVDGNSNFKDDVEIKNSKKLIFKPSDSENQENDTFIHNYGGFSQIVLKNQDHLKIRHEDANGNKDTHKFSKNRTTINNKTDFNDDVEIKSGNKLYFRPPNNIPQDKYMYIQNYGTRDNFSQIVLNKHDHLKIRHQKVK